MDDKKDFNSEKEAVDKASFADVNYVKEEIKEEKVKEGKKNRIYGIIILAVAVLALICAFFLFRGERTEVGLSNRFNSAIGVTEGDYLYHSDIEGKVFIKTNMKTGESEILEEKSVAFFSKYKGDIYYYDALAEAIFRFEEKGDDVLIYQGSAYYQQFKNGYIYFLEPNSNYGGIVKRVPVEGGEAEIVLNAPATHFAVEDNNIIYYDPTINSLLINKIKDTMENQEAKTSAALKSVVLAEQPASNINVSGKDVFFTDATDSYKMQKLDMSNGKISDINYETLGAQVNLYEDYLFYINPSDKHIYRMNLDGSDIKDLTGGTFLEVAGLSLYEDRVLFYALMGQYDENMQMQSFPYIAVTDFDGNLICCFNPAEVTPGLSQDVTFEEAGEAQAS